jgi:hypothetical protein
MTETLSDVGPDVELHPGSPAVLTLRRGVRVRRATLYFLRPLAADFGRAWSLEKFLTDGGDGSAYHVHRDGSGYWTCTCPGQSWTGRECRHIRAVAGLLAAGRL